MTQESFSDLLPTFLAWLDETRPRLALAVHPQRSTPDVIEFSFGLANPVLEGALTARGDLVVSVEWKDECWDLLLSEEVRPRKTAQGFVCVLCESQGDHRIFPSLEALYHDHLFHPLEDWINTKLAKAHAVALYRTDGGDSTWARLISCDDHMGSPNALVQLK